MDMDGSTKGYGPEYRALVEDLRAVALKRGRKNADAVMEKAMGLLRQGKLTANDIAALTAVRNRVEAGR
jgi:hypothetical protein